MVAGQLIFTFEFTFTVKQQVLLLPQASFALKHTCVTPIGKSPPDAGPLILVSVVGS